MSLYLLIDCYIKLVIRNNFLYWLGEDMRVVNQPYLVFTFASTPWGRKWDNPSEINSISHLSECSITYPQAASVCSGNQFQLITHMLPPQHPSHERIRSGSSAQVPLWRRLAKLKCTRKKESARADFLPDLNLPTDLRSKFCFRGESLPGCAPSTDHTKTCRGKNWHVDFSSVEKQTNRLLRSVSCRPFLKPFQGEICVSERQKSAVSSCLHCREEIEVDGRGCREPRQRVEWHWFKNMARTMVQICSVTKRTIRPTRLESLDVIRSGQKTTTGQGNVYA